jgi:hypothetical protein
MAEISKRSLLCLIVGAGILGTCVSALRAANPGPGYYFVVFPKNGTYGSVEGPYKTLTDANRKANEHRAKGSTISWGPAYSPNGQVPSVRAPETWYRVKMYSLDKRWNGRGWTYYYRAEAPFESPSRDACIRYGEGFVSADRRTIVINGVRYPYRKYDQPTPFTR